MKRFGVLVFVVLLLSGPARADRIRLKSGGVLEGKVVSQDDEKVVIRLALGGGSAQDDAMTIPRSRIAEVVLDGVGATRETPESAPDGAGREELPPRSERVLSVGEELKDPRAAAILARRDRDVERLDEEIAAESERRKAAYRAELDEIRRWGAENRAPAGDRTSAAEKRYRADEVEIRRRRDERLGELDRRYVRELDAVRRSLAAEGRTEDADQVSRASRGLIENEGERRIARGGIGSLLRHLTVPGKDDHELNASERWLQGLAILKVQTLGEEAAPAVPALVRLLGHDVNLQKPTYSTWIILGRPWDGKITDSKSLPREAAFALGRVGRAAVTPSLLAARDDNAVRRSHALYSLVWNTAAERDGRVPPAFLAALGDPAPEVRTAAAKGLRQFGGASAVGPLMDATVLDQDQGVRAHATVALKEIAERVRFSCRPLAAALESGDVEQRRRAARALTGLVSSVDDPSAATAALAKALRDPDPEVRMTASGAVARKEVSESISEIDLVAALRDESRVVRAAAARALGVRKDASAVNALIAALDDEDRTVRANAARSLGQIGDPGAVAPLFHALCRSDRAVDTVDALSNFDRATVRGRAVSLAVSSDEDTREAALKVLNEVRGPDTYAAFLTATRDASWRVRSLAVTGLGRFRNPRAVGSIIPMLKDESRYVRLSAVTALKVLGDRSAVDALIDALSDPEKKVASNAHGALWKLTGHRSPSRDPEVWRAWWRENRDKPR